MDHITEIVVASLVELHVTLTLIYTVSSKCRYRFDYKTLHVDLIS